MSTFTIVKRGLATTATKNAIKNVTIIGGGLMGSGIAQVAAQAGNNVTLVEINAEQLKKSQNIITASLGRVAKKIHKDDPSKAKAFIDETQSKIKSSTNVEDSAQSDLILEAIVENLDIKQKLFKNLDGIAPESTIFASNTSSLSIGDIAALTKRKDKFVGLHFFNPVPMMKLLEVVRIPETSEDTYKSVMEWGKNIGKVCITCKDTPGFVVNRLLVPYVAEAIRMMERGDASKEDIDIAMKLGAGYPMGPIELSDYTGHDTSLFIIQGWHKKYPDNPLFKPPESQAKLVKEGKLGRKTGEGYYKYNK